MYDDSLAYDSYEIIEGEKIMSPSPAKSHMYIIINFCIKFGSYLRGKKTARMFNDNMDVHLPDGNLIMPDVSVVCDKNAFKRGSTVYGVPDFVVEILSISSRRRDTTTKKDIYESNGVKEYWIVNPWEKKVLVHYLREGKLELDEIYNFYPEDELNDLNDEEKASIKTEIKLSIFEDFNISVKDIFYNIED